MSDDTRDKKKREAEPPTVSDPAIAYNAHNVHSVHNDHFMDKREAESAAESDYIDSRPSIYEHI